LETTPTPEASPSLGANGSRFDSSWSAIRAIAALPSKRGRATAVLTEQAIGIEYVVRPFSAIPPNVMTVELQPNRLKSQLGASVPFRWFLTNSLGCNSGPGANQKNCYCAS
jgi:hypothetical protein